MASIAQVAVTHSERIDGANWVALRGGKFLFSRRAEFVIKRQVTAHDFSDGEKILDKKTFKPWTEDTWVKMHSYTNFGNDLLYDTDAPDIPTGEETGETYNNFRQWLDGKGQTCSHQAQWSWQGRWKNERVTDKHVDKKLITLPPSAHYPVPKKAKEGN